MPAQGTANAPAAPANAAAAPEESTFRRLLGIGQVKRNSLKTRLLQLTIVTASLLLLGSLPDGYVRIYQETLLS